MPYLYYLLCFNKAYCNSSLAINKHEKFIICQRPQHKFFFRQPQSKSFQAILLFVKNSPIIFKSLLFFPVLQKCLEFPDKNTKIGTNNGTYLKVNNASLTVVAYEEFFIYSLCWHVTNRWLPYVV